MAPYLWSDRNAPLPLSRSRPHGACEQGSLAAAGEYHMTKRTGPRPLKGIPEHYIFRTMIARCENPDVPCYPRYGGRGIVVAPVWRNDFWKFYADMGPRPSPKYQIDRIDNDGPYAPDNCRWATRIEQVNNRRNTRRVVFGGKEMPLTDAVRASGTSIHEETIANRMRRSGLSFEQAIAFAPARPPQSRASGQFQRRVQ